MKRSARREASDSGAPLPADDCLRAFMDHLENERAASVHTVRNYRQALDDARYQLSRALRSSARVYVDPNEGRE